MARHTFHPGRVFEVWTTINGWDLLLAFDPGSQHVGLTPRAINALSLQPSPRAVNLVTLDSTSITRHSVYTLETVQAFGFAAHDVDAIEVTLPPGLPFHGVLGLSLLSHFRFTADYGQGWIEIVEREC